MYYIPGKDGTPDGDDIAAAGIGYAFRYARSVPLLTSVGVRGGPDDGNGVIVARQEFADQRIGFFPTLQNWIASPDGKVWLGWSIETPPRPEDVARLVMLRGHPVILADGNVWDAPVARAWAGTDNGRAPIYIALPQRRELDAEGQWTHGAIVPAYQDLWDMACKWWDRWMAACIESGDVGKVTLTFTEETDYAVAAIAANYHIGRLEVSALGLFTDAAVLEVLGALIDWPTVVEWESKKKDSPPDGSNIAGGVMAGTEAIARP